MRFAVVLIFLSVAVMVVMIYQAVRQELSLRDMKVRMVQSAADVKRKEEAIIEAKVKVKELKTTLATVNNKIAELRTKKLEVGKSTQELDQSLQGCTKEKARDAQFVLGCLLIIHCCTATITDYSGVSHFRMHALI